MISVCALEQVPFVDVDRFHHPTIDRRRHDYR
jgi:hypothetical protein